MSLPTRQVDLGILGSLATLSPKAATEAIEQLGITGVLFAAPGTAQAFEVITGIIASGERVHVMHLAKRVPQAVQAALGGPEVLAKLCDPLVVDKLPALPLLVDFARARQATSHARALLDEARRLVDAGDVEGVRQCARRLLEESAAENIGEILPIADVCAGIQSTAERRVAGEGRPGLVATHVPALDRQLGGGLPLNLVVIGAEGGRGKSGLALRITREVAAAGTGVGYITLEDAAESLITRLVDDHEAVSLSPSRFNATTHPVNLDHLHTALGDISRLPIWLTRHGRVAPRRLLALADGMRHRGAGVVFIDNSNEMLFETPDDRHRAMDDVLQQLREWAIRWQTPVVFVTHLTRDSRRTDADPIRRSDFAHSAGFERIARCMLGVRQLDDGRLMAIDCVKLTEGKPGPTVFLQMSLRAGVPTTIEGQPPKAAASPTRKADAWGDSRKAAANG